MNRSSPAPRRLDRFSLEMIIVVALTTFHDFLLSDAMSLPLALQHSAQAQLRSPDSEVELTHVDLNDQTLEGLRHRNLPLFSVQYHPEAAPGPHDSHYLFKEFTKMMEEWKG